MRIIDTKSPNSSWPAKKCPLFCGTFLSEISLFKAFKVELQKCKKTQTKKETSNQTNEIWQQKMADFKL